MMTFRVMGIEDVSTAEDYATYLRQNRAMLRILAERHAFAASDVKAMLREQDSKMGKRWRARRVTAPLRKLAEACKDASSHLGVAMVRFRVEYSEDMSSRTRSRTRGGRPTMRF